MLAPLLNIRWKQLLGLLDELGFFRTLFVLIISGFFLYKLHDSAIQKNYSLIITALWLLFVLSIHLLRKDKEFLKIHFGKIKLFLFSEYCIFVLPATLFLFLKIQILPAFLLPAGCAVISTLDFSFSLNKRKKLLPLKFIAPTLFELKVWLRRNYLIFPILTGLWLPFYDFDIAAPIIILLYALSFSSMFIHCEPVSFLRSISLSPKTLLLNKAIKTLLFFTIIVFPYSLVHVFVHSEYFYLPIISWFLASIIISFSLFFKYATFEPNIRLELNPLFVFLFTLALLIPFTFPIALWLLIRYYLKASKRIQLFRNA